MTDLPTQNECCGFYGTIGCIEQDSARAWAITLPLVVAATGCSDWAARDFLDSRHGRHFADEVASQIGCGLALEPAICAAIAVYQGWRIDRATTRRHGIPMGLPYLTGWVGCFEGMAEAGL